MDTSEKEKSEEKRYELGQRFLPSFDPKAVEGVFALEKQYRGTSVGLFALNYMMMRAGQVGDPECAVAQGRERALEILREHYLKHEDLDVLLESFGGGPLVFGGDALLKDAAEKSPHDYVRASALLQAAYQLYRKIQFKTIVLANPISANKADPSQKWMQELMQKWQEDTLARLKDFDVKQARKQAERLANLVVKDHADVRGPFRMSQQGETYMPKRHDSVPKMPKIPTSAERAEGLLFELTQLVVGESAPPLIGEDSDRKEFRLSDYKSKVVVVLFSADWCAPCKKLYPELRALQKKFDEKDFAVVSVMADREVKTVRDAITKGDITWRAVWDGEGGPIHSKWNITKLPTVYVFDEHGVVRSRDLADAESLVAALVKAKQPDRKDVPKKDEPKAKPLSSPQNMSSLDR